MKGTAGWPTTPTTTLSDPKATDDDEFGAPVAVSGKTAVVGAYGTSSGAGAAYIYVNGTTGWPTTPTTTLSNSGGTADEYFGGSVAVSGTTAVVGAPSNGSQKGKAYIYVKGASGWPTTPTSKQKDPAATSGDYFGGSVAVSGKTAIVGADGTDSNGGSVYIYKA